MTQLNRMYFMLRHTLPVWFLFFVATVFSATWTADNGNGTGSTSLYSNGTVALGVKNVTADFDNLIITTP